VLSTTLFFRPEYGFDLLVEAVARLRRDYPHIGLLAMGSGGEPGDAEALLRRRGLYESVHLAGDMDHDECLKAISRSDVFLRPTRADGDSISVREAVALGIPTVASRVGHRPEGVRMFPVGDVEALVESVRAVLRQRRRACARSPTEILRRLLELYGKDEGRNRSAPEWIVGLGRAIARTRGSYVYARARRQR